MTKTLLFLTLMLVAPVVGAEEILFNNCMKLHANTENEPLCDRFRYQPAEEAKKICFDLDMSENTLKIDQSDAEKWKEECDLQIKRIGNAFEENMSPEIFDSVVRLATLYCTRYNSALLEEMRNK